MLLRERRDAAVRAVQTADNRRRIAQETLDAVETVAGRAILERIAALHREALNHLITSPDMTADRMMEARGRVRALEEVMNLPRIVEKEIADTTSAIERGRSDLEKLSR